MHKVPLFRKNLIVDSSRPAVAAQLDALVRHHHIRALHIRYCRDIAAEAAKSGHHQNAQQGRRAQMHRQEAQLFTKALPISRQRQIKNAINGGIRQDAQNHGDKIGQRCAHLKNRAKAQKAG